MTSISPIDVTIHVVEAAYGLSYNAGGLKLQCKGDLPGIPPGAMTIRGSLLFSAIPKNGSHNTMCDGRLWSNGEGKIVFDLDDGSTATLTVTSTVPPPPSQLIVAGPGVWHVDQS
ncbi:MULTISPECIES: hypothetical protein [unclassified Inquilinus]|uniref:hypothetical protein n=1 Tax=unclassified Inquilinus TaxID=2645927 RepID=UPI003F8F3D1A